MRLSRLFQRSNPMLTFFIGLVLGALLTCTLTIKFWWCSYDAVQVDRDVLNIVQINEHFHAQRKFQSVLPSVDHQAGSGNAECICGSEIEALRQQHCNPSPYSPVIEPSIRPSSSVVSKPTEESFKPLRVLRNIDQSNLTSFLHPPASSGSDTDHSPAQYLNREFTLKQKLLVAVITCESHMKSASAVYDTWGSDVSQVLFFVGDECNTSIPSARGMPLVRLPTIHDTPCNSVTKTFSVLKYLMDNNYTDSYHWFMLAVDDMYLRVERLESLLMKLDSSAMVYLGRAANGREEDKLSLLPTEFYCLGSTGVVLSSGLVERLGESLEYCFSAITSLDQPSVHPDVEVGRCISRKVKVQCSQSAESKAYFYKDYDNKPLTIRALERNNVFKDLITFQPVPSTDAMALLHYHYKKLQFKVARDKTEYFSWQLKDMCSHSIPGLPSSGPPCEDAAKICDCDDTRCPSAGVVSTVPRAYRAIGIYDYHSWEYFDDKTIYNDRSIESSYWLHTRKDTKRELQQMLSKAVQSASEKYGRHLKFKKVIDGWVRHNPSVGSEFIVDCWFSDAFKRYIRKRVSLVRPLATNYITLRDSGDTELPINFIVPITHVNERLTEFMTMYEQLVLTSAEKVSLILSVYGKEDVVFVNKILTPYRNKYPNASLSVIEGLGEFSRGRALHLGMSKLFGEDLAFFCDVDMTISKPFLDRCRRNAIRGRRVYFPEFFKLYNMDYVYFNKKRPKMISLKRAHGHWAHYSYGMVCVYKSDYEAVGGMNTNIVGWGEEDVNFFEKVVRKNMEVLRSPDTGLSHRWHEKLCSSSLPSKQYKHCLSSRGENLADRIDLANFIYFKGVQLDSSSEGAAHPQLALYSNYSESEYP